MPASPLAERPGGAPQPAVAQASGTSLHLVDLSAGPRRAYRGGEASAYLAAREVRVPEASNRAARLPDGGLCLALGPAEFWLVGPGADPDGGASAWPAGSDPNDAEAPLAYSLDRRASHAQFALIGAEAPACLAKLCGVDLAPAAFPDLAVAQSTVARVAAIVVRADRDDRPVYRLFADRASAAYLWDCLVEAGAAFDLLVAGACAS